MQTEYIDGSKLRLYLLSFKTLILFPDDHDSPKVQGFRFYDSNQTDVKEQGEVSREYPGVEFPLQLSMCLKFYIEYDRLKSLHLLSFRSLESGYFLELRSKWTLYSIIKNLEKAKILIYKHILQIYPYYKDTDSMTATRQMLKNKEKCQENIQE